MTCKTRQEFRAWLIQNGGTAKECFVVIKRGKPCDDGHFWYLDAVEEALCFGWVDSTLRNIDGVCYQRFSPRRKNSNWTRLSIERVSRLEGLGLMTDAGRAVLPADTEYVIDPEVECDLIAAGVWEAFCALPPLYQRIRGANLSYYKHGSEQAYQKMLSHTVETAREGKTFGEWNDYGRLK